MIVEPRQVEFYESEDGDVPFEAWLESLRDVTTRARIKKCITQIETTGNLGDWQPVGGGVIKLVLDFGPGYRVFIGQQGGRIVVLLCGGDTSTEAGDIILAKMFWEDLQANERKEQIAVNATAN